jgi:branched-subunit amino acid transport protein
MSGTAAFWVTIALSGVGTYAIRVSFLSVAHRFTGLSPRVRLALGLIPSAALAALAAPGLLQPEGSIDLWSERLLAGVIAGLVGWWTKNVLATLVAGFAVLVVLQWVV